jgi:hypothetical protein
MHRHADTGPSHKRKSGYWLQIWIGYIVTNYRYTKVTIHRRRSKVAIQQKQARETRKGQSHLSLASFIRVNENVS